MADSHTAGSMRTDTIRAQTSRFAGRTRPLSLSLLGAAALLAVAERGGAQTSESYALTVHPRTMATATVNPAAGQYPLTGTSDAIVSVPAKCVGAHRCPLFIFLPGGGQPAKHITGWLRPVAEKYGMILLAPTRYDTPTIDAALKEVLEKYAIDPNRIAIIGRCASGDAGMHFGFQNPEIFSLIASISGGIPMDEPSGQHPDVPILVDAAFNEWGEGIFQAEQSWKQHGHPVTAIITLRGHEDQTEDYDFLGRWMQESWATHGHRAAPAMVANPLPLLTSDAMKQMTDFWTRFSKEPDSIRTDARQRFLHEVAVPVGQKQISTYITDMSAVAQHYPSVAEDLKQAGLTAQQHDAYRVALIAANVTSAAKRAIIQVAPGSTTEKNVAFYEGHPDDLLALARAGMEHPEKLEGLGGAIPENWSMWRTNPEALKAFGAMGIWRMP